MLSVEQEILRVHGRAARALANQSLPYSVCTILKDEEVYNFITPEQEEKDRNARSRYNGRLFLSWLQDVDDKWEKIKVTSLKVSLQLCLISAKRICKKFRGKLNPLPGKRNLLCLPTSPKKYFKGP